MRDNILYLDIDAKSAFNLGFWGTIGIVGGWAVICMGVGACSALGEKIKRKSDWTGEFEEKE